MTNAVKSFSHFWMGGAAAPKAVPITPSTANMRVCLHNFFDAAALSASPALLTTLPATNLQLTARDKTARSTSSANQTITGNWGGSAYKVDSFFIFRFNGQGGSVRLRLWANADQTGTSFDTGALVLSTAVTSKSYDWGLPVSGPDSVNDLMLSDAPFSTFFTNFVAKSFTIDFTNCQRTYWDIGRIFLGKFLEAPFNPRYGMSVTESYGDLQTRTKSGSLRTLPGQKWRDLKVDMFYLTDPDRVLWRDLVSKAQMNRDVAISIFPAAGGRLERDHVFNCQFSSPSAFQTAFYSETNVSHTFTEN